MKLSCHKSSKSDLSELTATSGLSQGWSLANTFENNYKTTMVQFFKRLFYSALYLMRNSRLISDIYEKKSVSKTIISFRIFKKKHENTWNTIEFKIYDRKRSSTMILEISYIQKKEEFIKMEHFVECIRHIILIWCTVKCSQFRLRTTTSTMSQLHMRSIRWRMTILIGIIYLAIRTDKWWTKIINLSSK